MLNFWVTSRYFHHTCTPCCCRRSTCSRFYKTPQHQLQVYQYVGIATRYGLDGPGIESRVAARFSAPVQNGPGAHPASYRMDTGSFPRVKRPGRDVDHPPSSSAEVKEKSRALPLLPLWAFVDCSWVNFTFTSMSVIWTHDAYQRLLFI